MININLIGYLVIFFGIINLARMAMFMVGSDIYSLKSHIAGKKRKKVYKPDFSVVIPAHNERKTILRCIKSVLLNDYPQDRLQIIFVDDGSTDRTYKLVKQFKKKNKIINLVITRQKQAGKANALNKGIKNYAKGKLVMCLDADSYIEKDAILKAASYFRDKKVAALAANIKIINDGTLLNLIQKLEDIICYQMKRAQTVFNIEYIIGGIGSTFRKSVLEKIKYYDTNTVTEDIDLTMKIIKNGNKKHRVMYAADVVAYTESCLDIKSLIKQRYRWKYGRSQTFFKNKDMFFNPDRKYSKLLTFFYLPFAIFCDIAFFFEPVMVAYILYLLIKYGDLITLLSAFVLISSYIIFNVLAENTISIKDKIKLVFIAPTMYMFFYVVSFVEYVALVKGLINLKKIKESIEKEICGWKHVERAGIKVSSTSTLEVY